MSALPMLLIVVVLLVLLPFLFGELMLASLSKLHLSPSLAFMCMIAIFAGSLVNIPVKSIVRDWDVIEDPLAIFGLAGLWPQLKRVRRRTIIAVNVGGCLVPTALALYEIVYLAAVNRMVLLSWASAASQMSSSATLLLGPWPASALPCRVLSLRSLRLFWLCCWRLT
jgi:uncharacterized membrane protein